MCETVLEYFKSIHVARDIRNYVNWWNERTLEYVFRDQNGGASPRLQPWGKAVKNIRWLLVV